MRKLLHTTVALSALLATSMTANAADVRARPYSPPPYVPPVYAPPPFSWTGFYVGGNIGGAWANRDVTAPGSFMARPAAAGSAATTLPSPI
jgi:outer membrane immunogenic protein